MADLASSSDILATPSRYGLRGNFVISPALRKVADHYSLSVERKGGGEYLVNSAHGRDALVKLLAPFLEGKAYTARPDGVLLKRDTLKSFLEFLHQPLRVSLKDHVETRYTELKPRDIKALVAQERKKVHRLLRFATTGNPDIPLFHDDDLEKEICDCHADVENKMKDDDLWALELELSHPENHGDHDHMPAAIPASEYDPEHGFVFQLHDDLIAGDIQRVRAQQALSRKFWEILHEATAGRYTSPIKKIVLSAREVRHLSQKIMDSDLDALLTNASFERKLQLAFQEIGADAQSLSTNINFLHSLSSKALLTAQDSKVQELLRASTALKPLLDSDAMRRIWGHYKFTDRATGMDNPVEVVIGELALMQSVLQTYSQRGNVSPAELQAISNRFAYVMTFARDVNEALCDALDVRMQKRGLQKTEPGTLKENFERASQSFTAPMLVGAKGMSESYMPEEYAETAEIIRKALGQGGTVLEQTAGGFAETIVDWAGDLWNFATESPAAFAVYSGIVAYIIMNAPDAQSAQDVVNNIATLPDGSTIVIPMEALESLERHVDELYAEAGEDRSCHFDQIGFYQYKHCISEGLIAGNAKTLLNLLPAGPAFLAAGAAAASVVGNAFFNLNILQNLSHGAFWGYTFKKGYERGPTGFKKLADLSSPLLDPLASASMAAARQISNAKSRLFGGTVREGIKSQMIGTALSLMPLAHAKDSAHSFSDMLVHIDTDNLEKLASGALHLAALEKKIEAPATLSLKKGWGCKSATIDQINYEALVLALREFDVTLHYISSKIGIAEDWHKEDLQTRLDVALEALETYAQDQDAQKLQLALGQNMEQLIGAQARHTGKSGIYSALFNIKADGEDKDMATMRRYYSAWLGRETRKAARAQSREESAYIRAHIQTLNALERGRKRIDLAWKALGRGGWTLVDGIVASARTMHESWHSIPYKKAALTTLAVVALAGAGYDAAGLDSSIAGQNIDSAMNRIAEVAGAGTGGTVASAFALMYNFVEDVLAIHVVSGVAFVLTGAAVAVGINKGVAPVAATIEQETGWGAKLKEKLGLTALSGQAADPLPCGHSVHGHLHKHAPDTQRDDHVHHAGCGHDHHGHHHPH